MNNAPFNAMCNFYQIAIGMIIMILISHPSFSGIL